MQPKDCALKKAGLRVQTMVARGSDGAAHEGPPDQTRSSAAFWSDSRTSEQNPQPTSMTWAGPTRPWFLRSAGAFKKVVCPYPLALEMACPGQRIRQGTGGAGQA